MARVGPQRQKKKQTPCVYYLYNKKIKKRYSFFSTVKPTRFINVSNLFYWSNTLHVSDSLFFHHQEFKTVHTATGICQILLSACQQADSSIFYVCRYCSKPSTTKILQTFQSKILRIISSAPCPRVGLDICGKSRPHRVSIPGPSNPQRVAIRTML